MTLRRMPPDKMSAKEPKKRDKLTGKLAIVIIVSAVLMLASLVMLFFVTKKEAALEGADRAIRLSAIEFMRPWVTHVVSVSPCPCWRYKTGYRFPEV